jgi:hypothetical protein
MTPARMQVTLGTDRQAVLQQFAARLDQADADALRTLLEKGPS